MSAKENRDQLRNKLFAAFLSVSFLILEKRGKKIQALRFKAIQGELKSQKQTQEKHSVKAVFLNFLPSSTVGQAFHISLSLVAHNVVPLGSQQKSRMFIVATEIVFDRNEQRGFVAVRAYSHLCSRSGVRGLRPLLTTELKSLHLCFKA